MSRTDWHCGSCEAWAITYDAKIPMHYCQKLALGMRVPLVRKGEASKIEVVERGDFIGKESVQLDTAGRPVMAVVITRDEGQDCTVYPPVASAESELT
jgi:hypothetical protein